MNNDTPPKGGSFLIEKLLPEMLFTRSDFAEEQKMMVQATIDFMEAEVAPHIHRFEKPDYDFTFELMRKAGALGLLAVGIPEQYDGLGLGFNTTMLICEEISALSGSLATAYGAHTGIGTLPILWYGSEAVKAKFLPKIATGEWISCYNLTEPGAGSDANSGTTKATLSPDGLYYEITGQKIWISNAGYARVFIVFARIEDDKNITAFVIDKTETEGITLGNEEHKLGIKSSSTRQVFYDKVKVPANQMLGQRGEGFKIAVNTLNAGRIKLAAAVNGAMQRMITLSVSYANQRIQFKKPISAFGAIQSKLSQMAVLAYISDAALYRFGQNIEDLNNILIKNGENPVVAKIKSMEEYAAECALLKVFCSEAVGTIADQGMQLYGGMGYSADQPLEAAYRDARIARIYEGTNEINKMLAVNQILRKALKGELPLAQKAQEAMAALMEIPDFGATQPDDLAFKLHQMLDQLKQLTLIVAGAAVQALGQQLADEQAILTRIADLAMQCMLLESGLVKAEKSALKHEKLSDSYLNMALLFGLDAQVICQKAAREVIMALPPSEDQSLMLIGVKRLTKAPVIDSLSVEKEIAASLIAANKWCF